MQIQITTEQDSKAQRRTCRCRQILLTLLFKCV